jgi:aminopeptidase 2
MEWWSELWLNEGFATFISWVACDHYFPAWKVFTSFVNGDFSIGQRLDSLRSSHPIEVEVRSPAEVSQVFDAISYDKGGSIIRMLYSFLGKDMFIKGVSDYLKKHSYSNATTIDLWKSIGEISSQDIEKIMYSWTRKIGYPFLQVLSESFDERKEEITLELVQQRFLLSGDVTPEEDETVWFIPIQIVTSNGSFVRLFESKNGTITFPFTKTDGAFWKLNEETSGFYRVLYQKPHLTMLGLVLQRDLNAITPSDRIGLISDLFAFARSGHIDTAETLDFLNFFKTEDDV